MIGGRERGSALLLVLWASVFLAGLLAIANGSVRIELRQLAAQRELFHERTAAHNATRIVLHASQAAARDASVSVPEEVLTNGRTVAIELIDQRSKIDLNRADQAVLSAALEEQGFSMDEALRLAARIADWRDADDLMRINGAEAPAYARAELPSPANRFFLSADELTRVLAADGVLRDAFTVSGGASSRLVAAEWSPSLGVTAAILLQIDRGSSFVGRTDRSVLVMVGEGVAAHTGDALAADAN